MTLKITNCFESDREAAQDELEISRHISSIQFNHEGRSFVRLIEDFFTIPGRLRTRSYDFRAVKRTLLASRSTSRYRRVIVSCS